MKAQHEATDGKAAAALRHAGEAGHFRRGVAGGWREQFTQAQSERFQKEMGVRLRGTGLEEVYY